MSSKNENNNLELSKFYSDQRDSQLKQLMALNGQGIFSVLGILAGFFIGGLSLKTSGNFDYEESKTYLFIIIIGITLLLISAALFSLSYNKRIAFFENLIREPKEINELNSENFNIRPVKVGSYLIFFGILFLFIGTFGIIFSVLQ